MKTTRPLLIRVIAASLPLLTSGLYAAGYSKAEFTRLFKEVKVLKENVAPKDATVGGEIDAVTSVATGEGSRAELKFPDNSLTRLGANSRFTLRGDQRTLDLNEGVMLLQVPKKIGGAKVRTAAVTAAVTGTTCLFEYLPGGFIKLIVIEGSVDLIDNSNPANFRTVTERQMIIMKADSKVFPEPVEIDLKLLLSTSNLISGDDSGMPNFLQVAKAVENQQKELKKGKLVATSFVLPGRGTLVGLTNDTRLNLFKNVKIQDTSPPPPAGNNNPPQNNGSPVPTTPTPFQGFQPLISGTTVLNHHSLIQTNPHVTAYNSGPNDTITSEGVIYDATVESPFTYFGFGRTLPVENTAFQPYLESKGDGKWAAFKFSELLINGTPCFEFPSSDDSYGTFGFGGHGSSGVRNVILAAEGDIRLARDNSFGPDNDSVTYEHALNLWYSGLRSLVLFSNQGSISLEKWFAIYGGWVDLSLVAAGPTSDVNLLGEVAIWGDLLVSAGQDVKIEHDVTAKNINIASGRDINIKGKTGYGYGYPYGNKKIIAKENMTLSAKGGINITNSSELKVLSNWWDHDALLRLEALGGDIKVIQSTLEARNIEIEAATGNIILDRSYINAGDVLKVSALGNEGKLTIGNSYLNGDQVVRLYAEGAQGGVYFTENATIQGKYISIAGSTVEIAKNKIVTVKPGYNKIPVVYTDTPNFNDVGNNYGKFKRGYSTTNAVTVKPFNQRNGP